MGQYVGQRDSLANVAVFNIQQKWTLYGLLNGEPTATVVREGVIYSDIGHDQDDLYTMLVTTGYLTVKSKRRVPGGILCELVTPNREVRDVYQFEILDRLRCSLELFQLYIMVEDLLAGKAEQFSNTLQRYIEQLASVHDKANKESFYHGLLLGMMALVITDYIIESNRESGYGRFDLVLFPCDTSKSGVVMEFKAVDKDLELGKKPRKLWHSLKKGSTTRNFPKEV